MLDIKHQRPVTYNYNDKNKPLGLDLTPVDVYALSDTLEADIVEILYSSSSMTLQQAQSVSKSIMKAIKHG